MAVMSNGIVEEEGTVREVFLNPKSDTARRLILPEKNPLADEVPRRVIRIVFDGQSSFEPVISKLTIHCNTMVNILGANTAKNGEKAYRKMLIELPKDKDAEKRIKEYLTEIGIHFEEGGQNNG